ncbi:MAG: polysaccharide biosynthesis C-terminal domain-containing protein [Candidatus Eiseniibacteriota bacterium]|nr:MAG: polysaccharide biosynthesis C-terminal domain-containing protein [Candidatus Eisenbacteria bacterium]
MTPAWPRSPVLEIARDSVRTFVSRIFSLATGAALSVLIARWLGPEGQGFYSLCVTASLVAAFTVNCGLGLSNVYFLGKGRFSAEEIASVSFGYAILGGVLGFVSASVVVLSVDIPGLGGVPMLPLILAFAAIPLYNLSEYYFYFLIGSDRIKHFNVASASRNALQLVLFVPLVVVAGLGLDGALLSWFLGLGGVTLLSVFFVTRTVSVRPSVRPDVLKASVSFGIKGYLSRIASFLYYRIDLFIVSYFLDARAVGYYAVSVLIAELLWNVPSSLAPGVMFKSATEDSKGRDLLTAAACRHALLVCLVAAGGIALVAKPAIEFAFGSEFLPSVRPLLVLLPGTAFLSVGSILANDFVGRGRQAMNSVAAFITLLINVPLNFILIPVWGISGAAAASAFSYCTGTAVMLFVFLRLTGLRPSDVLLPRAGDLRAYVSFVREFLKRS